MYIRLNPHWRVKLEQDDQFIIIKRLHTDVWKIVARLEGTRRALTKKLDDMGVVIQPKAQKELDSIPECAGFRENPKDDESA